jgi:glycosyltransferase involved in cell wall biosynthesis/GT2 family glycosyltransferase
LAGETPVDDLVSVVIPAYNPTELVEQTVASALNQTHRNCEVIVVDDGSDDASSLDIIRRIDERGDKRVRVVQQENAGLAAARNTGFRNARARWVVPLDADDLLEPNMIERCLAEADEHDFGFAYFDYTVFGDSKYVERPGPYNLYRLLNENFMACCCFVRRAVWQQIGGYDEWHRWGYEDWGFFLSLGKNGYFGHYIQEPLLRYRTHGRGLHYVGLERHESNWAHMQGVHAEILSPQGCLRVKRAWAPSVCFITRNGTPDLSDQTLEDFQVLENVSEAQALERSTAEAFVWLDGERPLRASVAEEAAWALTRADWLTWTDTGDAPPPSLNNFAGPLGVSRRAMEWPDPKEGGEVRRLPWSCFAAREKAVSEKGLNAIDGAGAKPSTVAAQSTSQLMRHLQNAELLSAEAWLRHPLRSASRLIPLRAKEAVNRSSGRAVFDLSFYLKFQPRSVLIGGALIKRLDYLAKRPAEGKRRIALWTPHLGVGGAESVLLELAGQIDRDKWEIIVVATQSTDSRLLERWTELADQVLDAAALVTEADIQRFLFSVAVNWGVNAVVLQNSAAAYGVLPAIKEKLPDLKVVDVLHAVDDDWDFFSATLDVAEHIDRRVVISEAGRLRLIEMLTPDEKIRLIRNGVDLEKFRPDEARRAEARKRLGLSDRDRVVLFVGRLDDVKRPLLLPVVARHLDASRFKFIIAGDGPLAESVRSRIQKLKLEDRFLVLGHSEEIPSLMNAADVLVIPSEGEGVPLALLEALASELPAVACRAGAIDEALPESCGRLVDAGEYEESRLAHALDEILSDDKLRWTLGAGGRKLVEQKYALAASRAAYAQVVGEL